MLLSRLNQSYRVDEKKNTWNNMFDIVLIVRSVLVLKVNHQTTQLIN